MNPWRRLTLHERWIARQQEQPGPEEDDRHERELLIVMSGGLGFLLGLGLLVGLIALQHMG